MSIIYGMHLGGVWGFNHQLEEFLLLDILTKTAIILEWFRLSNTEKPSGMHIRNTYFRALLINHILDTLNLET